MTSQVLRYRPYMIGFFVLASSLFLSACQTVPHPDLASTDLDNQSKQFQAKANVATVYIYRSELNNGYIPIPIEINGKIVGNTKSQTYLYQELPPGKYKVVAQADNVSTLDMELEAGKVYYVWQSMDYNNKGFVRSSLMKVSDKQGQEGVRLSKLILPPDPRKTEAVTASSFIQGKLSPSSQGQAQVPATVSSRSDKVKSLSKALHIEDRTAKMLATWQKDTKKQMNESLVDKLEQRKKNPQQIPASLKKSVDNLIDQQLKLASNYVIVAMWEGQFSSQFTDDELDLMLSYYSSATGQKDLSVQSKMTSSFIEDTQAYLERQNKNAVGRFNQEIEALLDQAATRP
jgi:hypothetical protein